MLFNFFFSMLLSILQKYIIISMWVEQFTLKSITVYHLKLRNIFQTHFHLVPLVRQYCRGIVLRKHNSDSNTMRSLKFKGFYGSWCQDTRWLTAINVCCLLGILLVSKLHKNGQAPGWHSLKNLTSSDWMSLLINCRMKRKLCISVWKCISPWMNNVTTTI